MPESHAPNLAVDAPSPRRRGFARPVLKFLGILLVVLIMALIVARLMLPGFLRDYVGRVLDQSTEFDGRVGEIDVHLWRGAYSIQDIDIVKTTGAVSIPYFECPRVDLSIDWSALWNGRLRGKVHMDRPALNFVDGASDEDSQTGADQPWLAMIKELFPFRIDKAEVVNGSIHFHAPHKEPPVHIRLSEVQARLTNLTNVAESLEPLMADVQGTALAMESGHVEMSMSLDPQSHRPTFDLALQLLDLDVSELNALTSAYGAFDFEKGVFDLVLELSCKDGFLEGYAKPLFRNLKVIGRRDLENDDPLRLFWEALVGLVGEVFENQPRDQLGTRITLEGHYDNPRTSLLEIIGNILYNAFVRAYLPRFEGKVAPAAADPDSSATETRNNS